MKLTIKRTIRALAWGLVAFVGASVLLTIFAYSPTGKHLFAERFIAEYSKEMPKYDSPTQVPDAYVRRFPNGESLAIIMEHDCCSGAGFNATVIYDSKGQVFSNSTYCFCGYEGLASDLHDLSVPSPQSLDEFYKNLKGMPLRPEN